METWKTIPSLENRYEASSLGRLRRSVASTGTRIGRILAQRKMPAGYMRAGFQLQKKTATRLVHRMVAEAFIGPCPPGKEVNHKDCDKANNSPDNLEYVTRSENLLHAIKATGAYRGERNSQAKITESMVREIRQLHVGGMGYKRLAKHFGLSWGIVRDVAARRSWKHV